jgi:hypothetical protein
LGGSWWRPPSVTSKNAAGSQAEATVANRAPTMSEAAASLDRY